MEFLNIIDNFITNIVNNMGSFAPLLACMLILVESILPIMPLSVFITINFYYLGTIQGFLISWILTSIGCYLSFILCRTKLKKHFEKLFYKKNGEKLRRMMSVINDLRLEQLVIIISIPFTPAFLVNIAAGLSNMNKKKFIMSIFIGKFVMVYFWGFVGTGLIESFENPIVLIKVGIVIIVAFILSKIVNKKYHVE